MVPIAIAFTLYAQGGGASAVSKVLAAESIPMVLLLLIGGAAADKFPRRRVMVAANLLCLVSQSLLAFLLLNHHAPLPVIMALMACIGVGTAFYAPGRQGLIPQIVSPENLQSANAMLSIAQSAGAIAGPVAAGLLVAGAGGAAAIALDALSYGISAALLLSLRPRHLAAPATSASLLTQLREGWSAFISRTWLWSVVLQFALIHLLVLAPIIVLGSLGFAHAAHGALGWGGLMSLFGAGSILGGLLAMRIKPQHPARAALLWLLIFAAMPASLAANLSYPLTGACFILSGVAVTIFSVLWDTIMQAQIPAELLARVSAYDMFGSVCLLPLGYILAAPLQTAFGRGGALWLAAGFTILSTLAVLTLKDVRELRIITTVTEFDRS
jgi:predicted MFS family arabinose efflux permease